ncbi:hypothetical protein ACL9RF_02930 [Sphingobacterium sp. Mn56C]|uniref:hypothetical protein n=1 Tax=Sphingobacterium sp. Mn56C TaxID=3395261 RepID=UPI003BE835FD
MKFTIKTFFAATTVCIALQLSNFALAQEKATVFTAKSPEAIYLGAVLNKASINQDKHPVIDLVQDDVTISLSINAKPQTVRATKALLDKVVLEGIQETNSLDKMQQVSTSFNLQRIQSWDDALLSIRFGQAINTEQWFGFSKADMPRPMKSMFVLHYNQIMLNAAIDIPESGTFGYDIAVMNSLKSDDLVYVNSVDYGRKAVALIGSELPDDLVKEALNKVLRKAELTEQDEAVLANTTVRLLLLGNTPAPAANRTPIQTLVDFIHKKWTLEDFAKPISFSLATWNTNALFENTFN